jgi:hypothetical protein
MSDYTNEFHNFYETAKKLVDDDLFDFNSKVCNIPNEDEQDFLMAVTTYFLQKHQEEVINKV